MSVTRERSEDTRSQALVAPTCPWRSARFLGSSLRSRPGWLTSPQSGKLEGLLDV